ncbi:MAG: phosphonate transport system ATP-binding protein [Gammaproteobacteria bacterium]
MLKFDEISHTFTDGTRALSDVSFRVPSGQFCVLLGPSGAGKSTLLGTVNGLVTPSRGRTLFDGSPVGPARLAAVQRRTGMVHQQLHLVPRLSVLHNVLCGALPAVPAMRAMLKLFPHELTSRACQLLDEVGLEETHLYRRASSLSGGQQQRVAIARAFMLAPDVVLADEPVASLDPRVSEGILALLRRSSRSRGTTVLCSLHQVEFAMKFADRIVALRDGRIVYDGLPQGLTRGVLSTIYGTSPGDATKVEELQKLAVMPVALAR